MVPTNRTTIPSRNDSARKNYAAAMSLALRKELGKALGLRKPS